MNPSEPSATAKSRLLIVDDDPEARLLLRVALAPHTECDEAGSGEEALSLIRDSLDRGAPYRVVILDVLMPGRDGLATLEDIRRIEAERRVPHGERVDVLMATAVDDADKIWNAHLQGLAAGYLVKPLRTGILLRRLRELGAIA
ncbi:response regulator receiver protein [Desulfovibrio sp. X2]|uniref:response regulator n=1 Tax=Desulfovibrio sp. X2 TaxID=941449 RepID=UPI000358CDAD|nr:response regulator [Desulfovibrio sp. X2]EPR41745.1 response regulator receiver protein [Desulfovibrio sp. X2]